MNKKQQTPLIVLTAVIATGLMIVLGAWAVAVRPAAANVEALRVDHQLIGEVELLWATSGVLSGSLVAPTEIPTSTLNELGEIALALLVENNDASVDRAYVDLEHTLVFTGEHTVDFTVGMSTTQEMAGPAFNGTYGSSLLMRSEKYEHTTQAGQVITRQVEIEGTVVTGLATGEYRETIWGYGLEPLTMVGSFEMVVIDTPTEIPTAVGLGGISATSTGSGQAENQLLQPLLLTALFLIGIITLLKLRNRVFP